MFKVLVLQSLYNLSDERIEFQIRDRLSFMRFLDLTLGDAVPDEKTIWLFREQLTEAGVIKRLFKSLGISGEKGFSPESRYQPVFRLPVSAITGRKTNRSSEDWRLGKRRNVRRTRCPWTRKNGQNHYGENH
jgi:IS5 family transposase